jgi:DNA N-6-adenine-methyltransferase (Dam)
MRQFPRAVLFSSSTEHWATPKALYRSLDAEFHFTFDPCPLGGSGGLEALWTGERVFCNPPYGPAISAWLSKSAEAAVAVYLLPARTDTIWFHQSVLTKAREVRFLQGRLRFNGNKGRAPFPSLLAIFGR